MLPVLWFVLYSFCYNTRPILLYWWTFLVGDQDVLSKPGSPSSTKLERKPQQGNGIIVKYAVSVWLSVWLSVLWLIARYTVVYTHVYENSWYRDSHARYIHVCSRTCSTQCTCMYNYQICIIYTRLCSRFIINLFIRAIYTVCSI